MYAYLLIIKSTSVLCGFTTEELSVTPQRGRGRVSRGFSERQLVVEFAASSTQCKTRAPWFAELGRQYYFPHNDQNYYPQMSSDQFEYFTPPHPPYRQGVKQTECEWMNSITTEARYWRLIPSPRSQCPVAAGILRYWLDSTFLLRLYKIL